MALASDWVEEETDQTDRSDQTDQISDGIYHMEADAADSAGIGRVGFARRRDRFAPCPGRPSARMEGAAAAKTCGSGCSAAAPIVPAAGQPLFDPIREGERALEYLDAAPPQIFAQILAAAAAAVGDTYASFSVTSSSASPGKKTNQTRRPAPSREALRRANAMASRVLRRACPYSPSTPPSPASCSAPSAPSPGRRRSRAGCAGVDAHRHQKMAREREVKDDAPQGRSGGG